MNASRLTLIAILTVRRDHLDAFRSFERQAARVMKRHGGVIERTVVIEDQDNRETLKEIHVVTFPDQARLEMYRRDEELAALAGLREEGVIATEIFIGRDGPDYSGMAREAVP